MTVIICTGHIFKIACVIIGFHTVIVIDLEAIWTRTMKSRGNKLMH